jgi:hypothetical protein
MKELLKVLGVHTTDPVDRAKKKAQNELGGLQLNPRRLRNYWYHYEVLAGDMQATGLVVATLNAHRAHLRRGLQVSHIEAVVDLRVGRDLKQLEIKQTAQRLQQVVKFSRRGLRTFPGTVKNNTA